MRSLHFRLTRFQTVIASVAILLALCASSIQWLRTPEVGACVLGEAAARGKQWSGTCKAACHDIDVQLPSHPTGGPNLHDVYMSLAGTESLKYGHQYGPPIIAAREAGVVWTEDNLDHYLKGPEAFLRRATGRSFDQHDYMNFFIGGEDEPQVRARQDVIAYLKAIKGQACD